MARLSIGFAALAALASCEQASAPVAPPALAAAPAEPVLLPAEIADFYRARGSRPLWVTRAGLRPEALTLAAAIAAAADHGLDPERYGAADIARAVEAAKGGDPHALARADLLLSRAFPAFVRDLRLPSATDRITWVDDELKPQAPEARALLDAAAAAPSLADHLAAATRMNPLYESLRRGHAQWRAKGGGTAAEEAQIRANLERARAIPADAPRYLIVDAGSARMWMVEKGRVEGPMRVIVGTPAMETPAMAGLIRYAALNPYWNLPPDLARERAKRVLREGPAFLARERLEILSDWSDDARVVTPASVDWRAVASGRRDLRMRQRPGRGNAMGEVKFMLPNELGIYLHDYPDKSLFARADRRISSGCVRLEDAPKLARWLFGGEVPKPKGPRPEQHVDLPEPVPVYITYLTALPDPKGRGIALRPDPYRRDRAMLARMEKQAGRG
ncbi:MAG: L,D-transpeptidase family protein [Allosphingosinicella sp.]